MAKKYLTEENYENAKKKIKKIGIVIIVVGLLIGGGLIALGVYNKMKASNDFGSSFGSTALFMFGGFVIVASLMFGGIITLMSKTREIMAYTTQSVMPIYKEGIEEMAPTVGEAIKTIIKEIKEDDEEEKK